MVPGAMRQVSGSRKQHYWGVDKRRDSQTEPS